MLVATAFGLVALAAALFLLPWQATILSAWCATAAVTVGSAWRSVWSLDAAATEQVAKTEDESRAAADLVVLTACVVSLFGVGLGLAKASAEQGLGQAAMTGLAVITVVLSWAVVHTIFVLRYADLYYRDGGGIDFGGDEPPDYRDFAYVSFTIGMTFQVSDTGLTSKAIRRTALRHALLSFLFGIAVIAMTFNVVASLLSR